MISDNTELARRAVACKRWRWMPGMLTLSGSRIVGETRSAFVFSSPVDDAATEFPDLTDPATVGCLHQIVCEAVKAFQIRVQVSIAPDMSGRDHATWTAVDARGSILARGGFRTTSRVDLMADGLVAALEAAP
jgi:hypothetical protein